MGGLPPADRIVVVPLENEYDVISLLNSGINALTPKHRQKAEALKAARADWELLIVNAKLVHNCGYDDHSNEFSVMEIYDEVGNCVTSEKSWLKTAVDFHSVAQNGMMLAADNEGECVSNWGPCKGSAGYYEEDRIYRATFLVSCDPAFEIELRCLGGCEEVAEVSETVVNTRDYGLLDRVLAVVESKPKSRFNAESCQILLQMLTKSKKSVLSQVTLVNKIIAGLSSSHEPDQLLYDTIIDLVDKLGHEELGGAIENLLTDVARKSNKDMSVFLRRMDFALQLNTRIKGDKIGPNYLEAAINDLNEHGMSTVLDSAAVVKSIISMVSDHKRQRRGLSSVVGACLTFLHRAQWYYTSIERWKSLPLLIDRTHLLKQLGQKKFGSLQTPLTEFVADFIRGLRLVIESSTDHPALESKLKGEGKDKFVQATAFVIKYGKHTDWDEFGRLAIKKKAIFCALIDAIMSDNVDSKRLLRDLLNKCLIQLSTAGYYYSGWSSGTNSHSIHVQKVIELYPSVARMMDKDKRLPLHHATDLGNVTTASFRVIMEVCKAYKPAASIRDPVTGLYPFQLAASKGNYKASFSLLLENPNLVSSAINGAKVSGRKRKRMRRSSA